MLRLFTQPLTRKSLGTLFLLTTALAALVWTGHWGWQKFTGRPPTTAQVRKQIWTHLRSQTRRDDFRIEMDWAALTNYTLAEAPPATTASAAPDKPGKADKQAKLLAKAAKAKAKKLPPLQLGYSRVFREKQKEARTYEAIYCGIGEELWVAEQFLAQSNAAVQQTGLILAGEAARYALDDAQNSWLAARICEGYLWPNLDVLERVERPATTPDHLLAVCEAAFQSNEETNHLVRNYQYVIRKSPKRADLARYRLALLYEQMGQSDNALRLARELQDAGNDKIRERIAALIARLQARPR